MEYAERCPKDVFVFKDKKLKVERPLECNMCLQCVDLSKGAIKVEADENKYLFKVETTCGRKPEEVFLKSIEVLNSKLDDFTKDLRKLK